jgi:hypothetical protein
MSSRNPPRAAVPPDAEVQRLPADWWEARSSTPLASWVFNCYGAACEMQRHSMLPGRPRYGAWTGPIAPGSPFRQDAPITRHGWLELPDGRVADPTRWVFEAVPPYVYVGPNDHYDLGNDRLRQAAHHNQPFPESECPDCGERGCATIGMELTRLFAEEIGAETIEVDEDLPIGRNNCRITVDQLFWIANLPIARLRRMMDSRMVLKAIMRNGQTATIPLDTRDAFDLTDKKEKGDGDHQSSNHEDLLDEPGD